MSVAASAIIPILLLLLTGIVLRRRVLTQESFWTGLAWMSYWVFTPALFIGAISETDLTTVTLWPLLLSVAAPVSGVAVLALALAKLTRATGPQLTSLLQGSIRINTYIGLICASALYGQDGVAIFALASAIVVPLVNLICVGALSLYGDRITTPRRFALGRDLACNPLILACATGLLINVLSVPLPSFVSATLDLLAAPALVCGTLIAGAAMQVTFRKRDVLDVASTSILKLAILPLIAMAIAVPLGVSGATLTGIVLICSVPTAPSAYILAARMGGDTRLMASITGVQTLLAAVSIPVMLAVASHFAP